MKITFGGQLNARNAMVGGETAPSQPVDTDALYRVKTSVGVTPNNAPPLNYRVNLPSSRQSTDLQERVISSRQAMADNPRGKGVTRDRRSVWAGSRFTL